MVDNIQDECYVQPILVLLQDLLQDLLADATNELDQIGVLVAELHDEVKSISNNCADKELEELQSHFERLVMRSQFADRITQRIGNSLKISKIAADTAGRQFVKEAVDWESTVTRIRKSFTMGEEHAVFDKVFDLVDLIDNIDDADHTIDVRFF